MTSTGRPFSAGQDASSRSATASKVFSRGTWTASVNESPSTRTRKVPEGLARERSGSRKP